MDLKELHEHGQSIWLDYIRRDLRGVTTNPSSLEKAILEKAIPRSTSSRRCSGRTMS